MARHNPWATVNRTLRTARMITWMDGTVTPWTDFTPPIPEISSDRQGESPGMVSRWSRPLSGSGGARTIVATTSQSGAGKG